VKKGGFLSEDPTRALPVAVKMQYQRNFILKTCHITLKGLFILPGFSSQYQQGKELSFKGLKTPPPTKQ
jgi:hypothetical protein